MKKKRFQVGESFYEIPDNEVQSFLSDNPKAVEVKYYELDGGKYNIPIAEVDAFENEMGLKKKETSNIGSLVGGLFGTGGEGRSVSGGVVGKIGKVKPQAELPIGGIEDYNKMFREKTGTRYEGLNLGSELPQIKKAREEQEYLQNRGIEENELNPVLGSIRTGTATPKQLQELYSKPYGQKVVADAINRDLPGAADVGGLDPSVFHSEEKWQGIAQAIQQKNRPAAIEQQNKSEAELDGQLATDFQTLQYGKEDYVSERKGDARELKSTKNSFGDIDVKSVPQLQEALDKINTWGTVWDAAGNKIDPEAVKEKIQSKIFQIKSQEPLPEEIVQFQDKIKAAAESMPVRWKKTGSTPQGVERDAQYVMKGLNVMRDTNPSEYKMILATLNATGKISEQQFSELAYLGKDLQYFGDFKSGQYVEPDDRDFRTPQIVKSQLSGWLSERLKQMGASKNRSKVKQEDILTAYQDAPEELKDEDILFDIIKAERRGLGGEGIAKTGGINAFWRGITRPLKSISNTVEYGFDSPFEAYLKSKKLDRGDQLIPNKKGGYTDILPSEKWLNRAVQGFGEFVTQASLAYGLGAVAKPLVNQVIGRVNPFAQINNRTAALNFGTPASTLAQTWGDEYIDFLEKTGDPTKASFGALVSGLAQGYLEKGISPDVLIAEKAMLLTARRNLGKEIIKVMESGGGKRGIMEAVKDFGFNITKTIGKEAWAEEISQNFANALTEAAISPKTVQDRNLLKESIDIGLNATRDMAIVSLLGAGGQTKVKRELTRGQLQTIAANSTMFLDALDRQMAKKEISDKEYELASSIVTKLRDNNLAAPKRDANGELISASRQLEYAYQTTVADVAADQMAKIGDPIQQEPFKKKIEEADKIKRKIFYGETAENLPPKKDEPIEIDQDRDLMDEEQELSSAEMKAVKIAAIEPLPGMYQEMLDSNPTAVIKEIANQAQGISEDGTPLEAYPAPKQPSISVQMPGEVKKPEVVEPQTAEEAVEDMTPFVEATRPELAFDEVDTAVLDKMDATTMAVQGKRLEGVNNNLIKLKELFDCIWS